MLQKIRNPIKEMSSCGTQKTQLGVGVNVGVGVGAAVGVDVGAGVIGGATKQKMRRLALRKHALLKLVIGTHKAVI